MRAVLDTNVVVSALIWGGTPFGLLEAAAEGRVDLVTSPALLAELGEVLRRPHLSIRLQRVRGSVEAAMEFYGALTISVTPASLPGIVADDPDDDQVIAAAIVAGADFIASGDRHLLSLGVYQTVRILRPAEALASISAAMIGRLQTGRFNKRGGRWLRGRYGGLRAAPAIAGAARNPPYGSCRF
jgi:putative PIN family toxin of toxin-antitoxin system